VLTGTTVETDGRDATHALRLSDVFANLPVAILEPL